MTGLTSVVLSATIMSDILRTLYIKKLVTLKTVCLNDREFCSYDIAGTLDKNCVLVGYHNFVTF